MFGKKSPGLTERDFDDVAREALGVARKAKHGFARCLELRAEPRIAGDESRARERLMFPRPCVLPLVARERRHARHEQSGGAVGAEAQIRFVQASGAGGAGAGAIGPGATGGDGGDGGDVATGTVAVEAGEFLFSEVTTRVEVLKKEVGPGS